MRIKAFVLVTATLALGSAFPANAAEGVQDSGAAARAMARVDYLIGTWSCAHTVGTFSGRYSTTWSKALGDRWLKQTYDFPPGNAADLQRGAVTADALMGYDEERQTWVRFFANSLGQHFEIRMTDTPTGWAYKYTTFFQRKRPETAEPDATFTRKSDNEYTIDGPTYPEGATEVTEHHTCRRV